MIENVPGLDPRTRHRILLSIGNIKYLYIQYLPRKEIIFLVSRTHLVAPGRKLKITFY
jgi:hypothetical protein